MAANSSSLIRVRLFFDYPPPAARDCRMCWLLVDLNTCRVVSDLESLIRDKFDFSSRSIVSLFVDDYYLPHTESVFVVRDNDNIRVKVDSVVQENGHSDCPVTSSKTCRKRHRPTDEEGPGGNDASSEWKEKKRKKKRKKCLDMDSMEASAEKKSRKSQHKLTEKTRDKGEEGGASKKNPKSKTTHKASSSTTAAAAVGAKATDKKTPSKKTSSDSSSEEDEAPKNPLASKPAPKTLASTPAAVNVSSGAKVLPKKTPNKQSTDSSSSSSEEDEAPKKPLLLKPASKTSTPRPATAAVSPTGAKAAQKKTPAKKSTVSTTDSSSSSSEEDEALKKSKPAPKTSSSTPAAAAKAPTGSNPTQKKPQPAPSSSSETDSSSDEADSTKVPPKNKPLTSVSSEGLTLGNTKTPQEPLTPVATPSSTDKHTESRDSSGGEEEIELIIRKPMLPPWAGAGGLSPWRGGGRGRGGNRGRPGGGDAGRGGGWGRGEGRGAFRGHAGIHESRSNGGAVESSYQTDVLTNKSVVVQNGAEAETAPKQDYSSMPLLAAPPQVGQKIAFKLLELTDNYTPEVSEYKEGRIVSVDPATKQIQLELLHVTRAPVEPGKFDLVYQNPDGSERVEYAVSRDAWVTERWDSLLEPRLLI